MIFFLHLCPDFEIWALENGMLLGKNNEISKKMSFFLVIIRPGGGGQKSTFPKSVKTHSKRPETTPNDV